MTFEVGSDGDKAQIDVNNRVQIAQPRLPTEVQRQGVTVLKRSNDILFVGRRCIGIRPEPRSTC